MRPSIHQPNQKSFENSENRQVFTSEILRITLDSILASGTETSIPKVFTVSTTFQYDTLTIFRYNKYQLICKKKHINYQNIFAQKLCKLTWSWKQMSNCYSLPSIVTSVLNFKLYPKLTFEGQTNFFILKLHPLRLYSAAGIK